MQISQRRFVEDILLQRVTVLRLARLVRLAYFNRFPHRIVAMNIFFLFFFFLGEVVKKH